MQNVDLIKQLNARYSIYNETINKSKDIDKMEEERCQFSFDIISLKPLRLGNSDGLVDTFVVLCQLLKIFLGENQVVLGVRLNLNL
jgi:hypothetical protein